MNEKNPKINTTTENEHIHEAHEQAEKDIEKDSDLNMNPDPLKDLDEGELAQLEGE